MLNKSFIQGNVTRDPEVRTSKAGNKIVKFGLAWNDNSRKDGEDTAHFYNVVCMGNTADFVEKYVKKGSGVIVESQVRNNRWEAEDGSKRSVHELFVGFNGSVSFTGSKRSEDEAAGGEPVAAASGEGSTATGEDKDYF
jgi:single-strand DNA-binding protein